jgi:DNA polymerase-3 subunit delta
VNFNISLRESESAYLISKVGSDPVAVEAELRKLSLYVNAMGKREVTKKDIDKVVTKSIVTKPWELADALSERNMALTLTLYSEMENDSPFAILAMCVTRMRELIAAKAMAAREPSERESLSKLFEGRDWQYENHGRWARNYTGDELVDALRRGVELEVAIKTGSTPREGREGLFAWLVDTIRA